MNQKLRESAVAVVEYREFFSRLLTKNFIYFGLERLNCSFRAQIKKLFYKLFVDLSQDPSLTNIFLKYICLVGRNLYVLFSYNLNYKLFKDTRQAV